eukprot:TRINITY_DN120715_c0_g1_i1.p1 TRINITY_DN120715_c0_g1~~TRINITY_DN120715_c0_g1_i1.p1  ORF type:complete len:500 (+),score=99.37 TRINITY_DN120715_c0_g1_i1:121-1620(+)
MLTAPHPMAAEAVAGGFDAWASEADAASWLNGAAAGHEKVEAGPWPPAVSFFDRFQQLYQPDFSIWAQRPEDVAAFQMWQADQNNYMSAAGHGAALGAAAAWARAAVELQAKEAQVRAENSAAQAEAAAAAAATASQGSREKSPKALSTLAEPVRVSLSCDPSNLGREWSDKASTATGVSENVSPGSPDTASSTVSGLSGLLEPGMTLSRAANLTIGAGSIGSSPREEGQSAGRYPARRGYSHAEAAASKAATIPAPKASRSEQRRINSAALEQPRLPGLDVSEKPVGAVVPASAPATGVDKVASAHMRPQAPLSLVPAPAPPGLIMPPTQPADAPGISVFPTVEVAGEACTRVEWRIEDLRSRLQASMGRPLVSPSFLAAGLSNLRLMVFPDAREAVKSARSRERKGMYAAMVKKGPLYGALKLKADGLQGATTVVKFNLICGNAHRGPFSYDFGEHAIHGCEDFGVDWLKQVDDLSGCLTVGVEILRPWAAQATAAP